MLLAPFEARAWNATGHMVVGAIAEERLTPKARQEAIRLLALVADPRTPDFISAGVWMDEIRADGVRLYDRWHYHNAAHSPDSTPLPPRPHEDNVAWAVEQSLRVLKSERASDEEKARSLRFLLHTSQDAHNPLHCGSRFTKQDTDGDSGGNQFLLEGVAGGKGGPETYRNLHSYWDAALGTFTVAERPLDRNREKVRALAQRLVAAYPESSLPERTQLDPHKWIEEGAAFLTSIVYPDSRTPGPEYAARCRPVAEKRAVLAGYRLAALLNSVWP